MESIPGNTITHVSLWQTHGHPSSLHLSVVISQEIPCCPLPQVVSWKIETLRWSLLAWILFKGLVGIDTLEEREGSMMGPRKKLIYDAGLMTASAAGQETLELKWSIRVVLCWFKMFQPYKSTSISHWIWATLRGDWPLIKSVQK